MLCLPATAQVEARLAQAQREYDAARAELAARRGAWEAQADLWGQAQDSVAAAFLAEDEARYETAQRTHFLISQELGRLDARVREAEDDLDAERLTLLEALDEHREQLRRDLGTATPDEARRIESLVNNLDNQVRDLVAEATGVDDDAEGLRTVPYFPAFDIDPRRDPMTQYRVKAEITERKVREIEEEVGRVDEQIARIEALETLRRQAQDAAASRDRFDQTTLPLGTTRRGPGDADALAAVSDTVGVDLEDLPPPLQLEMLRAHRAQLQTFLDEGRTRARYFRAGPRGGSDGGVG